LWRCRNGPIAVIVRKGVMKWGAVPGFRCFHVDGVLAVLRVNAGGIADYAYRLLVARAALRLGSEYAPVFAIRAVTKHAPIFTIRPVPNKSTQAHIPIRYFPRRRKQVVANATVTIFPRMLLLLLITPSRKILLQTIETAITVSLHVIMPANRRRGPFSFRTHETAVAISPDVV